MQLTKRYNIIHLPSGLLTFVCDGCVVWGMRCFWSYLTRLSLQFIIPSNWL